MGAAPLFIDFWFGVVVGGAVFYLLGLINGFVLGERRWRNE